MFAAFRAMLARDLLLAVRNKTDVLTTLFFFIIVVSLFPLGIGADLETLRKIGPGVVWVAALLATMLSLGRLFADDYSDGTLEQVLLSPQPLGIVVVAKITAHWLVAGIPLVLISPIIGIQYALPGSALGVLMLSLLIGTPILSFIGAIGAALTLGLRGGGVLLSVLVLPLYAPVLIFGSGAVFAQATFGNFDVVSGYLALLLGFLLVAAIFAPWAIVKSLQISLE